MSNEKPSVGDLRIWYMHQVGSGMKVYHEKVSTPNEGHLKLQSIYNACLHMFENGAIPDYANMGGLEIYTGPLEDEDLEYDWLDWYSHCGIGLDDIISNEYIVDGWFTMDVQFESQRDILLKLETGQVEKVRTKSWANGDVFHDGIEGWKGKPILWKYCPDTLQKVEGVKPWRT